VITAEQARLISDSEALKSYKGWLDYAAEMVSEAVNNCLTRLSISDCPRQHASSALEWLRSLGYTADLDGSTSGSNIDGVDIYVTW